jgi:hypothetical protein
MNQTSVHILSKSVTFFCAIHVYHTYECIVLVKNPLHADWFYFLCRAKHVLIYASVHISMDEAMDAAM